MKHDKEAIKEALLQQLPTVIERLYGSNAHWQTSEWRLGNVEGEPGGSLAIEGRKPDRLGMWKDHATDQGGDILGLIAAARNLDFKDALEWAADFLGPSFAPPPQAHRLQKSATTPKTQAGSPLDPAHPRSLADNRRALLRSPEALAYLRGRGLTDATIEHFRLGLSSYQGKGNIHRNALCYPVLDSSGVPRKRWLRYKIPGLTEGGPEKAKGWGVGATGTYWVTPSKDRSHLLVCEGGKDGWWLWQAIQGTPLEQKLCIISSTHGSGMPEEWKNPEFWQGWERVYAGQDDDEAGNTMAGKLREFAGRDIQRLRSPSGKDWTDFFREGGTAAQLEELLEVAPLLDVEVQTQPTPQLPQKPGLHAATPVDVNSAFVGGHLYVPFRVLERQVERDKAADGTVSEVVLQRYRTLVLRSDGTTCTFDYLPSPRGTPQDDRVLALSDGTIIQRAPAVDEARATFSLVGITRLREASKAGRSAMTMPPAEMLSRIDRQLKAAVVLPYAEDYALLTYVVLVSYCQQVFDAVPLVMVVGSAGSGKTDLGRTLAGVGCNASIITGQTSAATAARVLDQLNGLAVFDDLEEVASRSSGGDFSEFVQQLKVSYKKDTATKAWTNTKSMRVEKLNFYGVKVLTNTQGADAILATRMLRVYTRKLAKDALEGLNRQPALNAQELQELRDNLHIWVMESVGKIDGLYREKYADHGDRQDEITAPLRVLAELLPHPVLKEQLHMALERQKNAPAAEQSSAELLREAVKSLIQQGFWDVISLKQLSLEMQKMVGFDWGRSNTGEVLEWQEPRWVGRTLRAESIVDPFATDARPRLWGQQTRLVKLEATFVAETINELDTLGIARAQGLKQPLEFCEARICDDCPYAGICDMQPLKEAALKGKRKEHRA